MSDIAEFLKVRLDEDETAAKVAGIAEHIARHDPARALREVEAKRANLALHKLRTEYQVTRPDNPYDVICEICGWATDMETSACLTLRALAAVYSDHPDYHEGWK